MRISKANKEGIWFYLSNRMTYCTESLFVTALFTGSVFLTSGKFVNATNIPKLYFVVVTLLVAGAVAAIRKKQMSLTT